MSDPATRLEHDRLGVKSLPADVYDGVLTTRRIENFNHGIGTVTALNPLIGYDRSTQLAVEAAGTGYGIIELVREKQILSDAQTAEVLDPMALTGQRARS